MMIGFGISVVNFATGGTFFVVTSFASSGSQKKVYSDSSFGSRDDEDAVNFDGDVTSFVSSALGIQKKERSEMSFICGVIGDVMIFVGDEIQSDFTCCIGAVGTGISTTLCTGAIFISVSCWIRGEMI